jgi:hypothetical protein
VQLLTLKQVASCSLPAAGALALYLLQPSSRAWYGYLDAPFRRQIVENLSVLVAHIEILHTTYDGNYKLFCQAKRSLRRVVDILMQPANASSEQVLPVTSVVDFSPFDFMVSDYNGFNGGFWYVIRATLLLNKETNTCQDELPRVPPTRRRRCVSTSTMKHNYIFIRA